MLPNTIRTVSAIITGGFVWIGFNPATPLRVTVFGVLAGTVFYGGWWIAEYIQTVEEHNFHVDQQWLNVAETKEHRSDWHYNDGHIEVCDIHGSDCPTLVS